MPNNQELIDSLSKVKQIGLIEEANYLSSYIANYKYPLIIEPPREPSIQLRSLEFGLGMKINPNNLDRL